MDVDINKLKIASEISNTKKNRYQFNRSRI